MENILFRNRNRLPGLQVPRIHDDRLTNIDARFYLDPVGAAPPSHHNFFDGLAAFDGNHFFDAGESYDRARRHGRRAAGLIRHNLGPHKGAGSQASAVAHVGFDGEHTILLTDRRTQTLDDSEISFRIAFDSDAHALSV